MLPLLRLILYAIVLTKVYIDISHGKHTPLFEYLYLQRQGYELAAGVLEYERNLK